MALTTDVEFDDAGPTWGEHPPEEFDDRSSALDTRLPDPVCALYAPPPEPIKWIVQDLFTAGDVGLIVGDGGSFKSSAAVHIAAAIAGGYKAFGRFETIGPAPVLLCSAEDPGSVIQMRLEAFVKGHDWNRYMVLQRFHYFAMAGVRLKDPRWKQHLIDTVDRLEPAFIVMDPFVDLSGLEEENSNSEASGIMGFTRQLARRANASACFVHHATKSSEARGQSRIRGATTIANASRGTLFFEFTESGVMVEQLKMTYAEKLPPFIVTRQIDSEPTNRAQWISAKLATAKPSDARLDKAEAFVLSQVILSPRELNTNGLKRAAKGSGVWAEDVSKAVKNLFSKGFIEFEKGPNKSQMWLPTSSGLQVSRTDSTHRGNGRAEWAESSSGPPQQTGSEWAGPLKGTGPTSNGVPAPAHPPEPPEFDDSQADIWTDEERTS